MNTFGERLRYVRKKKDMTQRDLAKAIKSWRAHNGIEITYYIDIKTRTNLDREVIHYKNIPTPNDIFILVYVKQEDARNEIQSFLKSRNFIEGVNYLLVS